MRKICYDKNDEKLFNKLPKYAQKKATMVCMNKTADGWHCMLYFTNKDGQEDIIDEYGISDFMWQVRNCKDMF